MGNKDNYEKIIPENEEVRSGFKVSTNRKKVWNVELGLLEELKKICIKHNIKYYADGGTLLGAVRHGGYIPWDDDMDFVMFREDYDKFLEVAPRELPNNIKLGENFGGFSRLENVKTASFGRENRWENDFFGGICIDIFPIDYASKFMIINWLKSSVLRFFLMILVSHKSNGDIDRMKKWKKFLVYSGSFFFKKINYSKVRKIYEKINTLFRKL